MPALPPKVPGRIFDTDWTIANVAKLLRFNAGQGMERAGLLTGGQREMNQDYLRRTSARHLPSGVSVTFRRDERAKRHATLCFANLDNCLPWNDAIAEEWLAELFLNDRPRVREIAAATEDAAVRHFQLAC